MVITFGPRFSSGVLFLFRRKEVPSLCVDWNTRMTPIVANHESRRLAFRQLTATEFACLSSSRQLTLRTILRAQLRSRKAIAATAEWGRRQGDFENLPRPLA